MKKIIAIVLISILVLSSMCAFAATYRHDDITFQYDETAFDIEMDDHTDDEDLVILTGKNEAWGNTYIRIHLADLDDGGHFPTKDEFTPLADVEVTQGEWNVYKDVFMYTINDEDGTVDSFFIGVVLLPAPDLQLYDVPLTFVVDHKIPVVSFSETVLIKTDSFRE